MKQTLAVAIFALILMTALAQQNAHPVPPFKIFDNLYYVGIDWVCAYVVKTSGGLIMIDTLYGDFTDHVMKAIQQLGMNPKDVKYVIVTHGHNDHVGGVRAVRTLTGARVAMAEGDWAMSKLERDIVVEPHPFVDPDRFGAWLSGLLANAEKKLEVEKNAGRP